LNRFAWPIFVLTVIASCWDADPRSVRGALDLASRAIEARDGRQLFRVIDERSRHALISIVQDRRAAAQLVREAYPRAEREAALRALGDAADATDAAELFARRCGAPCMAQIRQQLGAPVEQREQGQELIVQTAQGGTLRMHRGSDSWWGLVWRTDELSRERDHAAQELRQIRDNAEVYRRRRALEAGQSARAREDLGTDSETGSSAQGSTPPSR
jgi:hypothetical protein